MKQAIGLVYNDGTQQVFETVEELSEIQKVCGHRNTYFFKKLFSLQKETVSERTWNNMSKTEQKIYSYSYYKGTSRRFTTEKFSLKYGAKLWIR